MKKKNTCFWGHGIAVLIILSTLSSCQTLKEIATLRDVKFALGALTDINLAGVQLDDIRDYSDITARDVLKLTGAFIKKDMPLTFNLNVKAENPSDNTVAARLVRMDWTLFLEERETISGVLDQERTLNPGEPVTIPVNISLDVIDFFNANARDIIELALSLRGEGGAPKNVKLVATPTVETILGPIRYPQPITVVNETVG